MTGYTRKWDCPNCGGTVEGVDWPREGDEFCDSCNRRGAKARVALAAAGSCEGEWTERERRYIAAALEVWLESDDVTTEERGVILGILGRVAPTRRLDAAAYLMGVAGQPIEPTRLALLQAHGRREHVDNQTDDCPACRKFPEDWIDRHAEANVGGPGDEGDAPSQSRLTAVEAERDEFRNLRDDWQVRTNVATGRAEAAERRVQELEAERDELRAGLERACDVSFTVGLLRMRADKERDAELTEWGERLRAQLVAIREVLSPGTEAFMAEHQQERSVLSEPSSSEGVE